MSGEATAGGRREFGIHLAAVTALCAGLPLISAYATGAIHLPHNDTWAYFRILFHLADTGEIRLVGMNEMMLLGQVFSVLPLVELFGERFALVNTFSVLFSAAALVATGVVARRFLQPLHALLVVVVVAVFPGFGLLVATFMTDNPAYAAQMCCVALALAAFSHEGRRRHYLVAAALLAGVAGFTVREFAITAPVAVVAGYLVAERRSGRSPVRPLYALAAVVAACGGLYEVRHRLEGDVSHFFGTRSVTALIPIVAQMAFSMALAVAPALVVALRRRNRPVPYLGLAVTAVAALGIFTIERTAGYGVCCPGQPGSTLSGNLLSQRGALNNGVLLGDRPILLPNFVWLLLTAGGLVAAAWLLALGAKRVADGDLRPVWADPGVATLLALGLTTAVGLVVRAALGGPLFDRYLTVPVAVTSILLLKGLPERASLKGDRAGWAVVAAFGVITLALVSGGHAFDVARWKGGELAVGSGIAAGDVDAGYEWVGHNYDGIANQPAPRRSVETGPGYMTTFPAAGNCGVVSASPQSPPNFSQIGEVSYRQWFGLAERRLWVYRYGPGCLQSGYPG